MYMSTPHWPMTINIERNHYTTSTRHGDWRKQRGRVVRAVDLKCGGSGVKSRSDLFAGIVPRWALAQPPAFLIPASGQQ